MKIAGIIAEYNPFHTGHAYHIAQTREKCGADYIVCVISGHFTQRGEPALYDKWARTRAALVSGADLVLELPFAYATQSAEGFADGGVRVLDALGCVDFLSFGAENADIKTMSRAAALLTEEPPAFCAALKAALAEGLSFPAARARALAVMLPATSKDLWTTPNNILGLEYLKALCQTESRIKPFPLERKGGAYSSDTLHTEFSSAQALRGAIRKKNDDCLRFLPGYEAAQYGEPVFPEAMFLFLMFQLRRMGIEKIARIDGVSEGLEYKIYEAAKHAQSDAELIAAIKSKRFTYTRIRRTLLNCMFGMTAKKADALKKEPLYARVLGVRKESLPLLSLLCAQSHIPVVTKASEFPVGELIKADILATDLYSLLTKKIAPAGRDFTERFLVI